MRPKNKKTPSKSSETSAKVSPRSEALSKTRDRSRSVKRTHDEISPTKSGEQLPCSKTPRTHSENLTDSQTRIKDFFEAGETDGQKDVDKKDKFQATHNEIEILIKKYLADATKTIMSKLSDQTDTLEGHSAKLQDIFMQNADITLQLDDAKERLDQHDDEMKQTTDRLEKFEDTIKATLSRMGKLEAECRRLQTENEELQAYGRRNALRFNNVPLNEIPAQGERKDTDSYVLRLINNVLKIPVGVDDISRSHIVGQVNEKCQIIVKFVRYNRRQQVYMAKSKLKGHKYRIYVTEDLTRTRYSAIGKLNKLRQEKKIYSYWTQDSRVFFKLRETGPKSLLARYDFDNSDDLWLFIKPA